MRCDRITHTMGTCTDNAHPYQLELGEDMRGMVPMEEMEPVIPNHIRFGKDSLSKGRLVSSPREGGVITLVEKGEILTIHLRNCRLRD